MRLLLLFFSMFAGLHLCEASNDCHCLQSFDGKYLRAWQGTEGHHDYWHVDLAPHCKEFEHWMIEESGGKVALKSHDGLFLGSRPQDIAYLDKSRADAAIWSAQQYDDGTWAFQASNGRWLSAHNEHGIVGTMANVTEREKFRLVPLLPTPIASPATCPALRYLTDADIPANFAANYTLDTTQKEVVVDGVHQLKCAPGSKYAYVSVHEGVGFRVAHWWWVTCSAASDGEWRTNGVDENYPMLDIPVGCVRPATCPTLRYLTQAEVPAAFADYTVDTTQKEVFVDGKHRLTCAPGSKFAYISATPGIGFRVVDWWLTCSPEAGNGWRTHDDSGVDGAVYPKDVPVGCVRPPPTCHILRYLTQAEVPAAFADYTVDTTQKEVFVDGKHRLTCAPGSKFAYISATPGIGFRVVDWWLTCSPEAGNGWRTHDDSGVDGAVYPKDVPVGCVRLIGN